MRASADQPPAEERILHAAVELFARCGYSGASTRDIARRAKVNEASLYRYFASKRGLFTAALERELQAVRAQLGCLRRAANEERPRETIRQVFHLMANIVTHHPELMRLMQFSALEFGAAMKPVYREQLGEVISVTAEHLRRWSEQEALPPFHAETTVLSFLATVLTAQNFYPLFARARVVAADKKMITERCVEVWHLALSYGEPDRQAEMTAGLRSTRP